MILEGREGIDGIRAGRFLGNRYMYYTGIEFVVCNEGRNLGRSFCHSFRVFLFRFDLVIAYSLGGLDGAT